MTVLAVGATGTVGPHVITSLTERGAAVRVLTRNAERARTLLPAGIDLRQGDPGVPNDLLDAAEGAGALFLLTSHDPTMADIQLRIVRTLRHTDIRIVKLSATSSAVNPDGPDTCRQHWEIEQVLAAGGKPYTILRPNAFMQTLIDKMVLPAARNTGVVPNAIGRAGVNLIDARDVGACAAEALCSSRWDGHTMVLTGPRAVTFPELANIVGESIGKPVRTKDVMPADIRRTLEKQRMPGWEARHSEEMFELFRNGRSEFISDDLETMIGRPPYTVERYISDRLGVRS